MRSFSASETFPNSKICIYQALPDRQNSECGCFRACFRAPCKHSPLRNSCVFYTLVPLHQLKKGGKAISCKQFAEFPQDHRFVVADFASYLCESAKMPQHLSLFESLFRYTTDFLRCKKSGFSFGMMTSLPSCFMSETSCFTALCFTWYCVSFWATFHLLHLHCLQASPATARGVRSMRLLNFHCELDADCQPDVGHLMSNVACGHRGELQQSHYKRQGRREQTK
jgi:hypothetical protein